MKGNFISVSKLTKKGFTVIFDKNIFEIKHGEKEVAYGIRPGDFYKFKTLNQVNACDTIEYNNGSGCVHEWHRHRVLGHRDIDVVKSLSIGE